MDQHNRVLSEVEALALIEKSLPEMPEVLRQQLATAVGYHPLALEIAISNLAMSNDQSMWHTDIQEIARLLAEDTNVGVSPSDDQTDRDLRVEKIIKYGYDALGRKPIKGSIYQKRLRALGSFAHDCDFDIDAAAALWGIPLGEALETLAALKAHGLIKYNQSDRWEQHPVLHGYARMLQKADEKLAFPERHAMYYLKRMQTAAENRNYHIMKTELPNLRHAFEWAIEENFSIAGHLLGNMGELFVSQSLGEEYLIWSEKVLERAQQLADKNQISQALMMRSIARRTVAEATEPTQRTALLQGALEDCTQVLPLCGDLRNYVLALECRAVILQDLAQVDGEDRGSRLRAALTDMDETLSLGGHDPQSFAVALANRAGVIVALAEIPGENREARLQAALNDYNKVLSLSQNDPPNYASVLFNLGLLYNKMGDHPNSLKALWSALQIFERIQYLPAIQKGRSKLRDFKLEDPERFEQLWNTITGQPEPEWMQTSP